MDIQNLEQGDLDLIPDLLPFGWEDEITKIASYTNSNFCFPIKVCTDKTIVGIGTTIIHNETAWLAHIIVHADYRHQKIGKLITQTLIETSYLKDCETIYLLATELGEPLYKKIGFETETEYVIFDSNGTHNEFEISENIVAINNAFKKQVLDLDRQVTGEDRVLLLEQHLLNGFVYLQGNEVHGFYLPDLGDGLIIATSGMAGQELMNLRLKEKDFGTFPIDNLIAADFMKQDNFKEVRSEKRLRLGRKRNWQPHNIYNIIGGNFG